MTNPAIEHLSRNERRVLVQQEARRRKSGDWGEWETLSFPAGSVGSGGWTRSITTAYRNKVFCVLWRDVPGGVTHLAVSSLTGTRPTWWEMQRIKDEIAGTEKTAVEVYPPRREVVDGADMFHIWVIPGKLEFSL